MTALADAPRHLPARARLAVALAAPTLAAAVDDLERAAREADVAELRLDLFEEAVDVERLVGARRCPVIATLRPVEQGGRSRLPPADRLEVLRRAARAGAEYVDLEWDAASPAAIDAVREAGAQPIVSRHDFARMPPDLVDGWWASLAEQGADVVKVVGTARAAVDCLPVLDALRRASLPTIAIAMGAAGLPTRVLAVREPACFLTFAALDERGGTAPGQVAARAMRDVYHVRSLTTTTSVVGVLGATGLQPAVVTTNAALAAAGLDAVAVPFEAGQPGAATVTAFRSLPVSGWLVEERSLQEDVLSLLDGLERDAETRGRANVVRLEGERLVGAWRDAAGARLDWLVEALPPAI